MLDFQNYAVNNLPNITQLKFKKVHKNYLKVILSNLFILFIIIFLALFFLIKLKLKEIIPDYIILIYGIFSVLLIVTVCIYKIGFSKRKYALREKDISYKDGLLFKRLTTVPFSRIQHIEVKETVFSQFFKLGTLSIYTAGDSSDDLEIRGITKEEAFRIKEYISTIINEK